MGHMGHDTWNKYWSPMGLKLSTWLMGHTWKNGSQLVKCVKNGSHFGKMGHIWLNV